jgi:ribosomal protein S5
MSVIIKLLSKFDDSGIKKAQTGFKGLGKVIGAVGIGLGAQQLVEAAKAASADAKSQLLLTSQLKRSTHATDAQIASNESYIQTLSNQLGIVDDDLRPAMSRFARVTGDVQKAQDLLQISLDASAGSGLSQEKVAKAVAQAYAGNTAALKRMFPELKNSKDVLADLSTEFSGFAKKKADPFAKFNVSMDNFKEQVGSFILPMLTQLMQLFMMPGVKETALAVGALVLAFKAFAAISTVVEVALGILNTELIIMDGALTAMGWGLIVVAIAAVAAGITYLATQTTFFQDVWSALVTAFHTGITWMADAWKTVSDAFEVAFKFIGNVFKGYVNFWISMFEGFINGVLHGVNMMVGGLNTMLDGVKAATFGNVNLHVNPIPDVKIPKLAKGGIVMPSPGGTNVTVGEAGSAEAIIPLNNRNGFGNTINVYVQSADPKAVVDALGKYVKTNGSLPNFVTGQARR